MATADGRYRCWSGGAVHRYGWTRVNYASDGGHTWRFGWLFRVTKIAILIFTPAASRLLATTCEREIALMAESILGGIAIAALPVPVWIHCANVAMRGRLADYLSGVQDELALGAPV